MRRTTSFASPELHSIKRNDKTKIDLTVMKVDSERIKLSLKKFLQMNIHRRKVPFDGCI